MIYMLSRCIAQGRKAGLMAAIGLNLGGYAHLTAATLGLSAVLAASVVWFTVIKWVGASYLIYLGIITLQSKAIPINLDTQDVGGRDSKTILNPKVAMFFLALLPQFVDTRDPILPFR
jgi:threonine/homoserine/homoserine lactone efflux protein